VRTKARLQLLNSTATSSPDVASGVVLVTVAGSGADGELPCDPAGKCKLSVKIPVKPEYLPAAPKPAAAASSSSRRLLSTVYDFKCVTMVGDVAFREETADTAFAAADAGKPADDGTVTCEATRGGAYLLTVYTRDIDDGLEVDQTEETAFTVPPATKPYKITLRFKGMSYPDIMANATKRAAFRTALPPFISAASGVAASGVQVGALTAGSVVTEITLHTPEGWTAEQVQAATKAITDNPASIFSREFLAAYGIDSVEASLSGPTPLPSASGGGSGGLTPGAQAGIAIGVIVAVLGAAGGGFFAYRKRQQRAAGGGRAPVFDNIHGGGAADAGGYVPPPAGGGRV
jgi:hypothetical protein